MALVIPRDVARLIIGWIPVDRERYRRRLWDYRTLVWAHDEFDPDEESLEDFDINLISKKVNLTPPLDLAVVLALRGISRVFAQELKINRVLDECDATMGRAFRSACIAAGVLLQSLDLNRFACHVKATRDYLAMWKLDHPSHCYVIYRDIRRHCPFCSEEALENRVKMWRLQQNICMKPIGKYPGAYVHLAEGVSAVDVSVLYPSIMRTYNIVASRNEPQHVDFDGDEMTNWRGKNGIGLKVPGFHPFEGTTMAGRAAMKKISEYLKMNNEPIRYGDTDRPPTVHIRVPTGMTPPPRGTKFTSTLTVDARGQLTMQKWEHAREPGPAIYRNGRKITSGDTVLIDRQPKLHPSDLTGFDMIHTTDSEPVGYRPSPPLTINEALGIPTRGQQKRAAKRERRDLHNTRRPSRK